jgi:GNAT superfamily N-acetyltransferase
LSPDFVIEARRYDDAVVSRLVAEVQQEYVERYGGPDETVVDPEEFTPPDGLFLVGLLAGEPVASGGWRRHSETSAEIKRIYVSASARRRGLARMMLGALEQSAREAGITRLVLGTGTEQPEAVALYEVAGYTTTDGFGHYAGAPKALFFGKDL